MDKLSPRISREAPINTMRYVHVRERGPHPSNCPLIFRIKMVSGQVSPPTSQSNGMFDHQKIGDLIRSGQISIIPKPELREFWGDSLTKPQFLR